MRLAWFVAIALFAGSVEAAAPQHLDDLVELALSRDPAGAAAWLERDAARERAAGAKQLPSPRFVLEMENVASSEAGMHVGGFAQMFPAWGERRAASTRHGVDAKRWDTERERVRANLRTRLWQLAARLEADSAEIGLLEEHVRQAEAMLSIAMARYRSGASIGDAASRGDAAPTSTQQGMSPSTGVPSVPSAMPAPPSGMAMPGQASGGMGAMGGSSPASPPVSMAGTMAGTAPGAPPMGTMSAAGAMASAAVSLTPLLRLDATAERLRAELVGARASRRGRETVLALLVGEDVAEDVAKSPGRFLDGRGGVVPESQLASVGVSAAEAELSMARAALRPDVMAMVGTMHDDEMGWMGLEVELGIGIPLGGGRRHAVRAASLSLAAAEARRELVTRDLRLAVAEARAAREAASARSLALQSVAVPRANAAFDSARRLLGAGTVPLDEVLLAWGDLVAVRREAIGAMLEADLRSAELARVEGP